METFSILVDRWGLAAPLISADFGLSMIAPVKKSVNHSKTVTSTRESVFVRGDLAVNYELAFLFILNLWLCIILSIFAEWRTFAVSATT